MKRLARMSFPYMVCLMAMAVVALQPAFGQQAQDPPVKPSSSAPPPATQARPLTQAPPAAANPSNAPAATNAAEEELDPVVLKVGNTSVTAADMESLMQRTPGPRGLQSPEARKSAADRYILMEVLSQKAIGQHLDDSPDFRRQMNLARLQWLAQTEYRKIMSDAKTSPEEIAQYYSAHSAEFEQIKIRQVTVRKKAPGAAPEASGLPAEEAKAKAEAIRKALQAGTDVKKVSEDFAMPNVVIIDVEPRTMRRGRPADEELLKLKDSDFSATADDPQAVHFAQVVRHEVPELKEVSQQIEVKIRDRKITEALDRLKADTPIWMSPSYFGSPAPSAEPPAPASPPPSAAKAPAAPASKNSR